MLPALFTLSPAALCELRARAADDPALQPALTRLREEADGALQQAPVSVMDKELAPPSGDKHDYMSFGPYWWPDPEKEDGLPFIRRDGEVYPGSQAGDRQALGAVIAGVETLALAYWYTRNEAYAAHAARLLRVFFLDPATRMNPHLEYGQAIPGRVLGRGVGIIDTGGLPRLVDAIGLLAASPAWTPTDQSGMVAWCAAYLHWLLTSAHGIDEWRAANNHGTYYDMQVAALALFVGQTDLARQVLAESTVRRIEPQIAPDGSQPHELARTKALGYSIMNLNGMFALAALGEKVGLDLWRYVPLHGGGLRAALDWLAPYADPAVEWPYPQIVPMSRAALFPLLYRGAIIYRDPAYEAAIAKLPPDEIAAHRARLLYRES